MTMELISNLFEGKREEGIFHYHYDDHQNHCQQFGLSDNESLARMSLKGPGECYVNWNKVALDMATFDVTRSRIFAPESW
ncbi:unnamed protein product [Onchocerca flexuosa]|uniref:Phage protein n=1 Tax=Onchocerca flexuosa TaxID=387005 RepID=A0A183HFK3_9BILA|nr:unnamed protein product [Onchocerca flexuosa]